MFGKNSKSGYTELLNGIKIKTIVYGEFSLMTEFILKKDSILPSHDHPYEQTGYLVKGRLKLYIGEKISEVEPGDSWNIPKNVVHKAEILEDSVALEIFVPLREDYLKFINPDSIFED